MTLHATLIVLLVLAIVATAAAVYFERRHQKRMEHSAGISASIDSRRTMTAPAWARRRMPYGNDELVP